MGAFRLYTAPISSSLQYIERDIFQPHSFEQFSNLNNRKGSAGFQLHRNNKFEMLGTCPQDTRIVFYNQCSNRGISSLHRIDLRHQCRRLYAWQHFNTNGYTLLYK